MKKFHKTIIVTFTLLSILALLVPMAFAKTPIVKQVTGGGWILYSCLDEAKKTFGFNAEELEDGTLRGNVQYVDHGDFRWKDKQLNVHGYDILELTIEGKEARIYGVCRLNGDNTPRNFFVRVVDEDEPGKHDWFSINISSIGYHAEAELGFPDEAGGGGNIQVHRPEPLM